jgi:hypothetical protein
MIDMSRRAFLDGVWTALTVASSLSLPLRDLHAEEVLIACTEHKPSSENLQRIDLSKPDTTSDLVRSTILHCYEFFNTLPAFYYVNNDRRYYYNAFAYSNECADPNNVVALPNGLMCTTHRDSKLFGDVSGEIGFGLPYLQQSLDADPIGDDVIRIIAHEFGHILQYNLLDPDHHLLYEVLHPLGATAKRVELHADFMSGVYLARRYTHDRHHDMSILVNYTLQGDDNRTSKDHHGTTLERRQAFRHGFNKGLSLSSISANDVAQLALSSAGYIMSEFE